MFIEAFCAYPFNRARITAEGNVAFCCFMRPCSSDAGNVHLKQEDTDEKIPESAYIGNVLEQPFDEIWFGELAEEVRERTAAGKLHPLCQCPGCPFTKMQPPYPNDNIVYNEYPNFLEIDLPNTHCNVGLENPNEEHPACVMCERANPLFQPEDDRLFDVLERIKHIVPNLHQMHIQGIAEPFWKDLIFQMMDVLNYDEWNEQVTISTTTNGIPLNERRREEWLRRAPHSITNFSIDAASPETYQGIRILPVFDTVLEHLYAFSEARVRDRQFLRIHNNINTMNVHEVVGMVQIAAKANVEYVEFNPTDGFNHLILVNEENCGRFRRAQEDIIEECEKLDVPYNFLRPLDMGLTDRLVQITL